MASQQQDAEMGDATNLVIVLAGELLKKAEELIRLGLKTSDIVSGYEKAQNFALKVLEGMCWVNYTSGGGLLILFNFV
jgi:T-complex protein 1 subunit theta